MPGGCAGRWHAFWDQQPDRGYDQMMRLMDRVLFGDSRDWACVQARGDVLEVAVGTGLNLGRYPGGGTLTGVDLSRPMLDAARRRAAGLDRTVWALQADAHDLPFRDGTFDAVVCTFGLCAIPDVERAVGQMHRVLRPGGRLLLVDHVASSSAPVRALQRLLELPLVPVAGEHFLRRPLRQVRAAGFDLERVDRFKLGIVERMVARKPA